MSGVGRGLLGSLGESGAQTNPASPDPGLQGRTWAVPFDDVWEAAVGLASGGLRGCTLRRANDRDGIIIAEARARFVGVSDFTISVVLDADAQTRVDARSISREGKADLGTNARRIRTFFRMLEDRLAEKLGEPPVALTPRSG
ncbi:MAG: DUF1499 domain-containing protein [Gemmatimonadota bacterium]|jgi:hypothetical protein